MKFLSDNLVLIVLLVLTVLALALLAVVVSAALRGGGAGGSAAARKALRMLGSESLRLSFRRAVKLIEANLAVRSERYNLSWTLLLNEGEGDAVPLLASGLPSALSAESSLSAAAQGIDWQFFDRGVVVQLRSQYLGAPDPDSTASSGVWDDFLGLCSKYRPQRPFDSVVLAIPCAALLAADAQGQQALEARAKAMHRRLWLAQNRLAMRFPVHVVITECESVPGFATFGAALSESQRRSMLGWVSPYELVAPFRAQWVDTAMNQVVGAVADGCAELCALEPAGADSSAYFLLPSEVERLRAGLMLFCQELMRPSAYHESFLLRGIYLTGDCSAAAVLQASQAGVGGALPASADGAVSTMAPLHTMTALVADADADADAGVQREQRPAFLRDIFERKIFPETGLVRASAQRLRRPAAGALVYWSAWLAPVAWAIALVVGGWQLHGRAGEVVAYLRQPQAPAIAPDAKKDVYGELFLSTLRNAAALDRARFGSLAMPGSWFDGLNDRLRKRVEQRFARDAVPALDSALLAETVRQTGAERNPENGRLIEGTCALNQLWHERSTAPASGKLELKDLPSYKLMAGSLDRLDNLDKATFAMQRLASPAPPSASVSAPAPGTDLALAVSVLFGKELPGDRARAEALYRKAWQTTSRSATAQAASVQGAARCFLHATSGVMYPRLFADSDLPNKEKAVKAAWTGLRDGSQAGLSLPDQIRHWEALGAALAAQQDHFVVGKGDWMLREEPDLGDAQTALLKRIRANRLLGEQAEKDVKEVAEIAFTDFRNAWQQATATSQALVGAVLTWTDKGWAIAPERIALRKAVAALLVPAYMRNPTLVAWPELPAGAALRWDKEQVERAAALIEARKTFQAEVYGALPEDLQRPAGLLVDRALAAAARTALAQAVSAAAPETPSAASDAERAAVMRLRHWLADLGARDIAADLDTLLTRDALVRLERLDAVVNAVALYVPPRDASLSTWRGEKGALVDVFGGGDAGALNDYVAKQQEFAFDVTRQAEAVLLQLGAPATASLPLVARWKALASDVQRYQLKSPTSSLMALEQFIVNGSADIDTGNCLEKLAGRAAVRSGGGLFAERLHALRTDLLARCRELIAGGQQQQWQRFAQAYNRDLGRRAPFAAVALAGNGPPADPDTVMAVMKLYDQARAAGALAERDPGLPGASVAVRAADQQLRRVRDLFGALYPAEEGQAGGVDVTAQFRVNGGAEREGNQIIDWNLTIGGGTVRLGEPARALRWQPGMPVVLSLRLARDGPTTPKPEAGRPYLSVAERTVTFRFDDPWALFSLIDACRAGDGDGADAAAGDGRAPLLRFEFPVMNGGAPGQGPGTAARARVFVRLALSAPGKRTPLAWPIHIPVQVPAWTEQPKNRL
ncbi:MAG: type VI secretion system protein [Duganella sp.]